LTLLSGITVQTTYLDSIAKIERDEQAKEIK